MAGRTARGSHASVGETFRGVARRERLSVGGARELAAVAGFDRHGLPFRGAAQLVRAALLSHASARAYGALAKLLCRRVHRDRCSHARVSGAACALLHEPLVGGKPARRDCDVEHAAAFVAGRAGDHAWQTELPTRLVMGFARGVGVVRGELAGAGFVQPGDSLFASAGGAVVSRSALAAHAFGMVTDVPSLLIAVAVADGGNVLAALWRSVARRRQRLSVAHHATCRRATVAQRFHASAGVDARLS